MMDQLKQAWERLRSVKGFTTWLWIVILFVVLAIGVLINEPLPVSPGDKGGGIFGSTGLALSVFFRWIAVIGFIYMTFLFFRKWQTNKTGPDQRRIKVVDRFHLSPKQTLLLVKTDDREFLVGATDSSIQLIAELDPVDESKKPAAIPTDNFESILSDRKSDMTEIHHE
jgi:flagellar biosynthetic protein FliO